MLTPKDMTAPDITSAPRPVWKSGTMLYPLPAVMVTCGTPEKSNIITVAWTGTLCTDPAMLYISVRPERYSHALIEETMEFTVNLTSEAMARATDLCGVRSGRDTDKWALAGLTPAPGVKVACPYIAESPLAIECRVRQVMRLGSHDMFVAEVLCTLPRTDLVDPVTQEFRLADASLMAYSHGHYYAQGPEIGRFGWSVRKRK